MLTLKSLAIALFGATLVYSNVCAAADKPAGGFRVGAPVELSGSIRNSELHEYRIELVTDRLKSRPFSIQPLPDGRILVTEKTQGLRVVRTDGSLSELVDGTPAAFDDAEKSGWGHGWLLDVALHPRYEDNGWVYLHHTQRCTDCPGNARSFNRVVRGRIRNGHWVDEEEIWYPGPLYFSIMPDVGAGGRLAFDDKGYLYISVGMKGSNELEGAQDLANPSGKIHRVHDDGTVPGDNPFLQDQGAYPTVWTYGHRNPQGLEFNPRTGNLWSTEMGPQGGDEINLLLRGRNYGWPVHSLGVNYDGSPMGGDTLADIDLKDIEQPVVDLTPAPAVSSFIFYEGGRFPHWQGHALIGSLKAESLYRIALDEHDRGAERELLIDRLGRMRDIETGPDGNIYLLLEHAGGAYIVRLVPVK